MDKSTNRKKEKKNQAGFTLVELLLYLGIVVFILFAASGFFFVILQSRLKNQAINEVNQQGLQISQLITHSIRNAENVNSPAGGAADPAISLDVVTSGDDPTIFDLADGVVQIKEGTGSAISLNNSRVVASDLVFENLSRPNTSGIIRFQFTLTYNNPEGRNEYNFDQTFYGSVALY